MSKTEWTEKRLEQLETLISLCRVAGSLNNGNRITDKILDLEAKYKEIGCHDFETNTESFLQFLNRLALIDTKVKP